LSLQVSRELQNAVDPASGPAQFAGKQDLPTLDDLNGVYGAFCQLCELGAIFNADIVFCSLCDAFPPADDDDAGDDVTPPDEEGDLCFSGISTIQTPHGIVTMKDLKVGDHVLTGSGNFEPVYAFGHKNAGRSADFLQFQTASAKLEMTGGHLVFLEGKINPVRADSIKVGDVLSGDAATVKKIKTIRREGVYSPLTPSGSVVVDGIVASSYISLQKHSKEYVEMQGGFTLMSYQDFIHMALSPFRMFTMGISSSMGNTYTEDGIPTFAAAGLNFAKWAESQNILVQAVLLVAFVAIAGACMVVENTFGPTMAPVVMAVGLGAYTLMKNGNISARAQKIKSV
jgi:Hint module